MIEWVEVCTLLCMMYHGWYSMRSRFEQVGEHIILGVWFLRRRRLVSACRHWLQGCLLLYLCHHALHHHHHLLHLLEEGHLLGALRVLALGCDHTCEDLLHLNKLLLLDLRVAGSLRRLYRG